MKKIIVVAGATGNLGERVIYALLSKGAEIRIIVRPDSNTKKVKTFEALGVKVYRLAAWNVEAITGACCGACRPRGTKQTQPVAPGNCGDTSVVHSTAHTEAP